MRFAGLGTAFLLHMVVVMLGSIINGVQAKAVFAHFMFGNTAAYTPERWTHELSLAQEAGIDAFALNMGYNDPSNSQLPSAFAAAQSLGTIQLFFSFDYAAHAGGTWPASTVINLIREYGGHGAYFKHEGRPLVSTFEGAERAGDWHSIKAETGCYFIPDWSSQGAPAAAALAGGVVDGLMSWEAWSQGGEALGDTTDAAYRAALGPKTYMASVSPWFYTNMPGYGKNWMWPVKTMDLWEQRWFQILRNQPEYVEILTWNDFGESHYIGPEPGANFFNPDVIAYDYIHDIPHDGWRHQLKGWIELYKTGRMERQEKEVVTGAYLLHSPTCSPGSTKVNRADHGQTEMPAAAVMGGDKFISVTALLHAPAVARVRVGGREWEVEWTSQTTSDPGSPGIYHRILNIGMEEGPVEIKLVRDGNVVASVQGREIGGCAPGGFANFNPVVVVGRGE